MENQVLSLISPTILIAIGLGLIAIEALIFSFVFFWFGLAFIIVGVLTYFSVFADGLWQLSSASVIAIALLLLLRTKSIKLFLETKGKENNDNFLNEKGIGVIKNAKVYYKATYWGINLSNKEVYKEGERVSVLSVAKGIANIEKIKE